MHVQRPLSRVAIPTPFPGPAAPEPLACASRACALWQLVMFLCKAQRGGPPAATPPPGRRPPAPPPTATLGPHPLSTPLQAPTTTNPSIYTSSNPPIHPPPHLSRIPPPTARPPCARSCNLSLVWCCSLFELYNTCVCHLSNVPVRCGACADASRPKTLGAPRGGAHGGASRHSPRACRRAPAPSDWSCSQLRYSSVRESNDQAPASVSIAFERWPVGVHRVRGGADAAPRTVSGLGVGLERFQRPLRP